MKIFIRRKIFLSLLMLCFILVSAEVFLRVYLGFCDTVLMREDVDYELIAAPNQNRFRFRNHIYYNAFSMRSAEVDSNALKIVGFGDSVLNGGTLTEQDSLATTLLSDILSGKYAKKVQFLNISSAKWGVKHFYHYLKKEGNFQAKHIFIFLSGGQIYNKMTFQKVVGVNEDFPNKQYKLALFELWEKYIFPAIILKFKSLSSKNDSQKQIRKLPPIPFQTEWKENLIQLSHYAKENNIPISLYFHANLSELQAGKYDETSQFMVNFAQENGIEVIQDLQNGLQETDFRDHIHLSEKGQRNMAFRIAKYLFPN